MEREELFRGRMKDLADAAYSRGIVTFSDFLDLYEIHMIHGMDWRGCGVTVSSPAAMQQQSVRWQRLFLMLFLMIGIIL